MEALGTAQLTDTIPPDRALSVAIPRREISDVLKDSEATPQLVLRVTAGGAEPAELGMSWHRDELERLLRATSGPEVVLTFDRDQLAHAIGDVEAHGARSRAAVFAVAAAGALGSGATIANAMPAAEGGASLGSTTQVPAASVPSTGDGGALIDLHQPSTADLIGGAFVLAIAGASFAARRVGTARTV